MLHLLAVFPAFLGAMLARSDAGPKQIAHQLLIRRSDAGDDLGRGKADIGAIEILPDAGYLVGDVLFTKAGVRTGIARLVTRVTGRDAFDRFRVIGRRVMRVRLEHLSDVAHGNGVLVMG
jgi:hypothetical protein